MNAEQNMQKEECRTENAENWQPAQVQNEISSLRDLINMWWDGQARKNAYINSG